MPDGLIFTKRQALALFYQIGAVPDPTTSGDAVNLAYFEANGGGGGGGPITGEANVVFTGDYGTLLGSPANLAEAMSAIDALDISGGGGPITGESNVVFTGDYGTLLGSPANLAEAMDAIDALDISGGSAFDGTYTGDVYFGADLRVTGDIFVALGNRFVLTQGQPGVDPISWFVEESEGQIDYIGGQADGSGKIGHRFSVNDSWTAGKVFSVGDNLASFYNELFRIGAGGIAWAYGGFDVPSSASGDLLYYDGTSFNRLGIGTEGQVLTVSGDVPNWETPVSGEGGAISWVASGDLVYAAGSPLANTILPVGTANQQLAVNDDGDGIEWVDPFTAESGLNVDGSNWMTGPLMSTDTRVKSRAGILSDVDDDFDDSSVDSNLWDTRGSPTETTYLTLNGNNEGLLSTYWLDGDFDMRLSLSNVTANFAPDLVVFRATFTPTADALAFSNYNSANQVTIRTRHNVFVATYNGSSGTTTGQSSNPGGSQTDYYAIRLTRVGGVFHAYLAYQQASEHDITDDEIWTEISYASYSPSRVAQIAFGIASGSTARIQNFHLAEGTVIAGTPMGPAWKIDSFATFADGQELVNFYNGDSDDVDPVASLHADGSLHIVGDFDATGDIYMGGSLVALASQIENTPRQIVWYMDGVDATGDLLAYQMVKFGEGPYDLSYAYVDYRGAAYDDAEWEIEYCASGDFMASGEGWTSVFSTTMTVDSGEYTSESAATPPSLISQIPEGARLRVRCITQGGQDATITLGFKGTT